MKYLFLCIAVCFLFICCSKQTDELSKVAIFIEALKENRTEGIEAPDFNTDHISELLDYRNERLNISNFTRNPLSSFYMEEVNVGMYVLWTIESIRLKAIDDPNFYLFASLNPRVRTLNSNVEVDQEVVFPDVAKAYFEWWNSSLSFEEKLKINPLEELDLVWN